MLQQRIFGLALGYDDLNDHDTLRLDPAFQTSVDRMTNLASSPTLCRLEKISNRKTIFEMHKLLVENFIASFSQPPEKLVLDFAQPITRSMASKKVSIIMAIINTTVFYPCTFIVAITY